MAEIEEKRKRGNCEGGGGWREQEGERREGREIWIQWPPPLLVGGVWVLISGDVLAWVCLGPSLAPVLCLA